MEKIKGSRGRSKPFAAAFLPARLVDIPLSCNLLWIVPALFFPWKSIAGIRVWVSSRKKNRTGNQCDAQGNRESAAAGNANLVGLLSEKSKCLRAYTILVVNERPVLNIRFGKGRAAVWMLVFAVLCIASAGGGIAMAIKRRGR